MIISGDTRTLRPEEREQYLVVTEKKIKLSKNEKAFNDRSRIVYLER